MLPIINRQAKQNLISFTKPSSFVRGHALNVRKTSKFAGKKLPPLPRKQEAGYMSPKKFTSTRKQSQSGVRVRSAKPGIQFPSPIKTNKFKNLAQFTTCKKH